MMYNQWHGYGYIQVWFHYDKRCTKCVKPCPLYHVKNVNLSEADSLIVPESAQVWVWVRVWVCAMTKGTWICKYMNTWICEYLNMWIPEYINIWIYKRLFYLAPWGTWNSFECPPLKNSKFDVNKLQKK